MAEASISLKQITFFAYLLPPDLLLLDLLLLLLLLDLPDDLDELLLEDDLNELEPEDLDPDLNEDDEFRLLDLLEEEFILTGDV